MLKKKYRPTVLALGVIIALLIYSNFSLVKPEAKVTVSIEQPQHGYLVLFTDVVELTAKHMLFLKKKSN